MRAEIPSSEKPRRRHVIAAVTLLGCAIGLYLFVSRERGGGYSIVEGAGALSTRGNVNSLNNENSAVTAPLSAMSTTPSGVDRFPISAEHKAVIETSLNEIRNLLNQSEIQSLKIINEKDFEKFHEKLIEIPQPQTASLAAASAGIKKGLALLPNGSKASRSFEAAALRLLAEYSDRPKLHKILRIRVPHDPAGRISLDEYYVDDMRIIESDGAGSYAVKLGNGKDTVIMRDDANFGGPKSWSKKRYGHLIETKP